MSETSAIETDPESGALTGGWLVNIDGDEIVEMTRVQVVASFGSGRLQEHTLVWHEGMDDWMPLVQVPAFRLLSLRESNMPESGARIKTRSKPPPKPVRNRETEVGLGPANVPIAGTSAYVDSDSASDSVTLSRDALEMLSHDVLAIAEHETLDVQETGDSVTVARALLEASIEEPAMSASAEDTSVLAVYERPLATVEFPTGEESTPGAKLDDDPTQMRAPIVASARPPAPARKVTPIAFPPPAPQNAEAIARSRLPAPITTSSPRPAPPALRSHGIAARVAAPIRPAAGTPAIRPSTLPPAPERRPPVRNPPPEPLEARKPSHVSTVPVPVAPVSTATKAAVAPPPPPPHPASAAPARMGGPAPAPVSGPTPVAFAAQAAPATAAIAPAADVPATLAPTTSIVPNVVPPPFAGPAMPAAISAPVAPPFRATSTPSLWELDAVAMRGGRRVPLLVAVAGCLASAVLASVVTVLVTSQPAAAPVVASVPVPAAEAPKAASPLPPPAPAAPPVTTPEAAPSAKTVATPPPEKPKKAPAAWRPRPKPAPVPPAEAASEASTAETAPAPAPSLQGDSSDLEKPAATAAPAATSETPPTTFNPGF